MNRHDYFSSDRPGFGSLEKKETAPINSDLEGARREDALALLAKIKNTDDAHPMHWAWYKKWFTVVVYCLLQIFVTLTSTTYVSVEFLIMEKWTSSHQVATLGQSLFIAGTAVGPAFWVLILRREDLRDHC